MHVRDTRNFVRDTYYSKMYCGTHIYTELRTPFQVNKHTHVYGLSAKIMKINLSV